MKKRIVGFLCIVAMILCMAACGESAAEVPKGNDENVENNDSVGVTVLGEGQIKFTLTVTDKDGNETCFEVNTDKKTVGEALFEHNLIEGEEGEYGLYIKTVNGITADFEKDQTYWAFYIDGEYANSGVDTTEITEGSTYSLKVEK